MSPWQSFLHFLGMETKPELAPVEPTKPKKTGSALYHDLEQAVAANTKATEDLHATISGGNLTLTQIMRKDQK